MTKAQLNILITAQDQASKVIQDIGGSVKNTMGKMAKLGGAALLGIGGAMTAVGGMALKTAAEFETMKTALETSFQGSKAEADAAFDSIKEFTAKTPYGMAEVMGAFIKLKNMGLDPSQRALTAYGDTASAMGKSLNDMVEAVADAATGEFERLKEFGIRAASEGDRVKFTFKGVTTEVGKNSEEIQEYLLQLGETNFAGGMAKQSTTLAGLMSTLKDTFAEVLNSIAVDSGLLDYAKDAVIGLGDIIIDNKDLIVGAFTVVGDTVGSVFNFVKDIIEQVHWVWTQGNWTEGPLSPEVQALLWSFKEFFESLKPSIEKALDAFVEIDAKIKNGLARTFEDLIDIIGHIHFVWTEGDWMSDGPLDPSVQKAIYDFKVNLEDFASKVIPFLTSTWRDLTEAFDDMKKQVMPILEEQWERFKDKLEKAWKVIQEKVWPAVQDLWDSLLELWEAIKPLAYIVGVVLIGVLWLAWEAFLLIIDVLPYVIEGIVKVIDWIVQFATEIANFISGSIEWLLEEFDEWKKNNKELIEFLEKSWNTAIDTLSGLYTTLEENIDLMVENVKLIWDQFVENINGVISIVKKIIDGDFKGAWEEAKGLVQDNIETIEKVIGNIEEALQNTVDFVTESWSGIGSLLETPFETAKKNIEKSVEDIKDAVNDAKKAVANMPSGGGGGFISNIGKDIGKAAGRIFSADGGLVPGNSFTGDKLTARVNSGEMILNRGQQQNLFDMIKSGQGGGGNVTYNITINSNTDNPRSMVDQIVNELAIRQQNANLGAIGTF